MKTAALIAALALLLALNYAIWSEGRLAAPERETLQAEKPSLLEPVESVPVEQGVTHAPRVFGVEAQHAVAERMPDASSRPIVYDQALWAPDEQSLARDIQASLEEAVQWDDVEEGYEEAIVFILQEASIAMAHDPAVLELWTQMEASYSSEAPMHDHELDRACPADCSANSDPYVIKERERRAALSQSVVDLAPEVIRPFLKTSM